MWWRDRESPDSIFAYGLVLPALLVSIVLLAYPLGYSFWVSLHHVTLGSDHWTFAGLDNYTAVVRAPLFWPTMARTLYFSGIVTAGTVVLALAFALVLNQNFPGRNFVRGILILPWSLSQTMLALTFGWIYNSTFGPLNGLLFDLHIIRHYIAWFASGPAALTLMAAAFVWGLVPFAALLFLGSLQTIPEELVRAAQVDGASPIRRFGLVTLPWIRQTVLIVIVISMLTSFLAFAVIYVLTGGGPGTETTLMSWWGYTTSFVYFDLGTGAAIFYILALMSVGTSGLAAIAIRYVSRS